MAALRWGGGANAAADDPGSGCFFLTHSATTGLYTLSLHDALPISRGPGRVAPAARGLPVQHARDRRAGGDRKSTRLNSSHSQISYAVFCLKQNLAQAGATRHGYPRLEPIAALRVRRGDLHRPACDP